MIIADSFESMQVGCVLIDLFWCRLVESEEDTLAWAFMFRYESPDSYRETVLRGLRQVIESADYSYVEKAAFYMFDMCHSGEVYAEKAFRQGWQLLTDDPYPAHPAPLQVATMILEDEKDCAALRALLVCCFNREATRGRRERAGSRNQQFREPEGCIGYNLDNPNVRKRFAMLLRQVILDGSHTFLAKAKFFIRDYYQDGEEAAREIFKRIFSDICPNEPNPLA